jgi:hypothetical protein
MLYREFTDQFGWTGQAAAFVSDRLEDDAAAPAAPEVWLVMVTVAGVALVLAGITLWALLSVMA